MPAFQANVTPRTADDPDLDPRFRAIEQHLRQLDRLVRLPGGSDPEATSFPPGTPPQDEASEFPPQDQPGADLLPGDNVGDVPRWDGQQYEPFDLDTLYLLLAGGTLTGQLVIAPGTLVLPLKIRLGPAAGAGDAFWEIFNNGETLRLAQLLPGGLVLEPESAGQSAVDLYAYGAGSLNPGVITRSAGGTRGTKGNVSVGQRLSAWLMYGWGGGAYRLFASIYGMAQETFGSGSAGGRLTFSVCPVGSVTLAEIMRIVGSGVAIGGAVNPHASAIFELNSTTQAFRLPRMTTAEKDAIADASGLAVWDTDLDKACVNNGTSWETVTSA